MVSAAQTKKLLYPIAIADEQEPKFVNTEYFANVCHEILTPLHAIVGIASILAATAVNPQRQKECAVMLQDSSNMLMELINDLLDSFKIDSGSMEIDHTVFDLAKILEEARNIALVKAQEKGIGIEMHFAEGFEYRYLGDPHRIRQIVLNLLGNAVKFTRKGNVLLHMEESSRPDGCSEVHIKVIDCGVGIDTKRLDSIFEKYVQGSASVSREYGGSGLGLFISQELAHLMKGNITVQSSLHSGSQFVLTLPLQKAISLSSPS